MKLIYLITLLLSFVVTAKVGKDTVAIVNGRKISKEHFERTFRQNQMFVGETAITKEKVLQDLINRELGIAKARKEKLDQDPLVKEKMEDVMFHAMTSKDLEKQLAKIKVSDKEVRSYYRGKPEYRTAHILLRTRANPSRTEEDEALKKALEIYQQIQKNPGRFPELANKYSQTPAAATGGDIGFQPAFRLAPEYFKAIKGKKNGYISPPVRTQFGFHIVKVLDKKEYKDISKEAYKKVIYDTKRDKLLSKYFQRLRKQAKIQINKDLLK